MFLSNSGDAPPINLPLMKASQNCEMSGHENKRSVTNLTNKKYIKSNQYARKMMSTNKFSSSHDRRKKTTLHIRKELSSSCSSHTENKNDISCEISESL